MNVIGTLGLILAGGASRRFGGRDKAWLHLAGRPLICHCHARLAPQVDRVVVSANRHRWAYRRLGIDAIADDMRWAGRGPLAAVATALARLRPARLALWPVDAPLAPDNVVAALSAAIDGGAPAAAVVDDERQQPLFCVLGENLATAAAMAVLREPVPSMRAWLDAIGTVWVDRSQRRERYSNINTPDDLERFRRATG